MKINHKIVAYVDPKNPQGPVIHYCAFDKKMFLVAPNGMSKIEITGSLDFIMKTMVDIKEDAGTVETALASDNPGAAQFSSYST